VSHKFVSMQQNPRWRVGLGFGTTGAHLRNRPDPPDGGDQRGLSNLTVLSELHRDLSYLMTGKGAWVAGADRREAPGPKPEHLGRRLRLRHQPPRSWQLLNGGDQRGVARNGMHSVLPRSNLGGADQLVRSHEQTGTLAPSENGRLPPVVAHQLAIAHKSLIGPSGSPDWVTY
jgi:hypothetical protein